MNLDTLRQRKCVVRIVGNEIEGITSAELHALLDVAEAAQKLISEPCWCSELGCSHDAHIPALEDALARLDVLAAPHKEDTDGA